MAAEAPTILATSMGFNRARTPWQPGPVFAYALDLARAADTPRICLVPTAGGDQAGTIEAFHAAFARTGVVASHLTLFDRPNVPDVRRHLLQQDVVWVDRGSVVNLLAVWRCHDLQTVLHECWAAGVVLAGESAGSLCWHSAGVTDSFGDVRVFTDGLGFLPFSNTVHHEQRRQPVLELLASGALPPGYATDAGAGLRFSGTELVEAFSDRPSAGAYRLGRATDGSGVEEALPVRRLRR